MLRSITLALAGFIMIGAGPADTQRVRFDGHIVIRAEPRNVRELQALLALTPDVWSHRIALGQIDVRIEPEARPALEATGIPYDILIDDLQRLIDREAETAGREPFGDNEWFEDYKSNDQINAYLRDLADLRPEITTLVEIGRSIEGRPIFALEITGPQRIVNKPGVFFNGCQHAREWVSPMATVYIADQLIRLYDSDPDIRELVDTMVFHIVPVVNPDGYVYSWTTNRMWRKNRRDNGNNVFGIDLNRNWSYQWGGVGSSSNPGSNVYRGTAPFSEPESAAVRDYMLQRPWIVRHVDIHSYSQYVLYPWGFTPSPTIDGAAFIALAQAQASAFGSVHGVPYQPGQWYSRLYPSSGIIQDWVYQERAAYSFTYELRDRGQFGFLLPREQIIPTSEETFAAALTLATSVAETRMLLEATSLVRGARAGLRAHRGEPGRMTYFVYTFSGYGQTFVPPLNVTLNLDQPVLIGSAPANDLGVATLARTVPANAPPRPIWLQAAQVGVRSNVVEREIE